MLKFFRKYNKWILVVGGCLLMVAFLIEGTLGGGGPGDNLGEVIGHAGDEPVTLGDSRRADAELAVLRAVNLPALIGEDQPLRWTLMQIDAKRMGLDASQYEAMEVLLSMGVDEARIAELAQQLQVSQQFVRDAVRHWVTAQHYQDLVLGRGFMPMAQRLQLNREAAQMYSLALALGEQGQMYALQALTILDVARGRPRLSEPMVQRLTQDRLATVQFTGLVAPAGKALPEVGEPEPARVQALYEEFKDKLPNRQNEPGLPFGYRTPDRVRFEVLAVPLRTIEQTVLVDEAEAIEYYEANRSQFRAPASQGQRDLLDTTFLPYSEVRDRVMDRLRGQKAEALADRAIKLARAMLLDQARTLPEEGGYRVIPQGWQPMPLTEVAHKLETDPALNVKAVVQSYGERWFDRRELTREPGIGNASTQGRRPIAFADYALSTKEIAPADSTLASMTRLQVGLPSLPLIGLDGTRYLFRLTAAEPSASPRSLDAVREQVVNDARLLAAYELLKQNRQAWIDRALAAEDWGALAEAEGLTVIEPPATPRRVFAGPGRVESPSIEGLGQAPEFLDALFDQAVQLADALEPGQSVDAAPMPRRVGAAGADPVLSLVVYRIDAFNPIRRDRYEMVAASPELTLLASDALQPDDAQEADPLSLEAIKDRVQWKGVGDDRSPERAGTQDAGSQA